MTRKERRNKWKRKKLEKNWREKLENGKEKNWRENKERKKRKKGKEKRSIRG